MNILEYIEMLMEQGMSEEEANTCANVLYNDDFSDDDYYDEDMTQEDSWDDYDD